MLKTRKNIIDVVNQHTHAGKDKDGNDKYITLNGRIDLKLIKDDKKLGLRVRQFECMWSPAPGQPICEDNIFPAGKMLGIVESWQSWDERPIWYCNKRYRLHRDTRQRAVWDLLYDEVHAHRNEYGH